MGPAITDSGIVINPAKEYPLGNPIVPLLKRKDFLQDVESILNFCFKMKRIAISRSVISKRLCDRNASACEDRDAAAEKRAPSPTPEIYAI